MHLSTKKSRKKLNFVFREQSATDQIELARVRSLLLSEKNRLEELEQCMNAKQRSDLEALLDSARHDKEILEKKLADTQEQLAVSHNDITKQKDHSLNIEKQIKICKNDAQTKVCIEYKKNMLICN